MNHIKSGFAALLGRPNVGKSTLLNLLLNEKISIISPKPQTTRTQILGIKTSETAQIIFIDTPGIHQDEKRAINRYMNRIATLALLDAEVIVFIIDATMWKKEDELVLEKLSQTSKPVILAINKIDLLNNKNELLVLIDKLNNKYPFKHIIPISAHLKENISTLEDEIIALLPEGPLLFPENQTTDKDIKFRIAEIIREKILIATHDELPYTTAVAIDQIKTGEQLTEIAVTIWVERQGQKIIIIGKDGKGLKKIGTKARLEIETLLGQKVFLRLWVKVKSNWTDNDQALRGFGYE
jgi:GTPase